MEVKILSEHGYDLAILGFSLSYKDRAVKVKDWFCSENLEEVTCPDDTAKCEDCSSLKRYKRSVKAANANAGRGKGHDKFLRQIMLWMEIEAPRYWWSEFDTYKVGVVAQSESTMHTIMKRDLVADDFVEGTVEPAYLNWLNTSRQAGEFYKVKGRLLESYLQRRLVTLNYAVLGCMISQRKKHRLKEWHHFINACYDQCKHPELLPPRA